MNKTNEELLAMAQKLGQEAKEWKLRYERAVAMIEELLELRKQQKGK